MSENLLIGNYSQFPENYNTTSVFEIGAGDEFYPHSGYIIDNTMSITHVPPLISNGVKNDIQMIRGWRIVGQSIYDNKPLTDGIIIYIKKEDYEANFEDLNSVNLSLIIIDSNQTIWNEQVIIDNIEDDIKNIYNINGEQGYELRISFNPVLTDPIDKITGIYLSNNPTAGPAPLYGEYSLINGCHSFRPVGNYGYSFGNETVAQGTFSFSQGNLSSSYGYASHSEGSETKALGSFSHSEGIDTYSFGIGSHAEGEKTQAIGRGSASLGFQSETHVPHSFAAGIGTITKGNLSVAVGKYNTGECFNATFEVGIGTETKRKTGFFVSQNGLCYAPESSVENLQAQGDQALITKGYGQFLKEESVKEVKEYADTLTEPIFEKISEIKNSVEQVNSYIIETGCEDTIEGAKQTVCHWLWEKWSDGKAVCWGMEEEREDSCTNPWGSLYATPGSWQKFPSNLFIQPPWYIDIKAQYSSNSFLVAHGHGASANNIMTNEKVGYFQMVNAKSLDKVTWKTTFYAIGHWRGQYIMFEPNGGLLNSNNSIELNYWSKNEDQDLSKDKIPIKEGYNFLGWYDGLEEKSVQIYDKEGYTNESKYFNANGAWIYPRDLVAYAKWNANKLNVYYSANGGTVSDKTIDGTFYYNKLTYLNLIIHSTDNTETYPYYQKWTYNNKKINGLANASTFGLIKEGYDFVGWNTKEDGTGTTFDQNDTTIEPTTLNPLIKTEDCDLTLYAMWRAKEE